MDAKDADLNIESGFRDLSDYLRKEVLEKTSDLARKSVVNDVRYVAEHLALSIQGEIAALRDPAHNQEFVAELEKAREKAGALRKRTARWQNVLNDGITDLVADIEYDFRDRVRIITREAEQIIDGADPGDFWKQFGEWLEQRTAGAVGDNFVWAHERAEWLAGQVSDCFAESGAVGLPTVMVSDTAGVLDPVPESQRCPQGPDHHRRQDPDRHARFLRWRADVRLLTGAMGMALLNPLSLGAGVMLGVKSYRDDRMNRVSRRQSEAKNIVRRQMDEVSLHVLKQAKDRLRIVQRTLRDHFGEIAEELHRSLSDSVEAAQRAARTSTADRDRRIAELRNQLTKIEGLQKQTIALSPGRRPAKQVAA